jgi:beta-lactamase class A
MISVSDNSATNILIDRVGQKMSTLCSTPSISPTLACAAK